MHRSRTRARETCVGVHAWHHEVSPENRRRRQRVPLRRSKRVREKGGECAGMHADQRLGIAPEKHGRLLARALPHARTVRPSFRSPTSSETLSKCKFPRSRLPRCSACGVSGGRRTEREIQALCSWTSAPAHVAADMHGRPNARRCVFRAAHGSLRLGCAYRRPRRHLQRQKHRRLQTISWTSSAPQLQPHKQLCRWRAAAAEQHPVGG